MNSDNFSDTVGRFLDYRYWKQALQLLKFQLKAKKTNRHFNYLEMFYYEKLEASFAELESKEYFKNKVANNLFYGLSKEFAIIPYTIPKSNLGLRQYKFMTCPLRILYYAIGLYLLELSQEYPKYHKSHKQIHAGSGGNLCLAKGELDLEPDSIYYKKHYEKFQGKVVKENKGNTKRKVVIRLDIANYFDELSIPKLLELLERYVKPSIQKNMCYDAKTRDQLVSFFDFVMGGTTGIPQSDNNIISDFIGYLFLVFGDLFLDDEINKHSDSVDNYAIIRYVDDIYISITFKKQDGDLSDTQSTDLKKKVLNSLAPRISDCLYEKLGLRLNPKTRHFDLSDPCHKKELNENLKKVSQGFDIANKKNNKSPATKLNEIFGELKKLKKSISPYFQEPSELDTETLKEVYDDNVRLLLKNPTNQNCLKEIFMDSGNYDFELVNADPSRIIIMILECDDVSKAFENFLLSKEDLTSRDVYLILSYLCQTGFNQKEFYTLLKQSLQMKEVMEIFEAGGVLSKSLSYGGLTEEQTLKIAHPDVIEQIRLRVLCELKGEHSVALNHLLNEIQAICRRLENVKSMTEYGATEVTTFLKNQQVPHETHAQIRNLFDRRNKNPVSHSDPIAWAVDKDEYLNYRSDVGDCLKHLGENGSLKSS